MKIYTIKPLKWVEFPNGDWHAGTLFGHYTIRPVKEGWYWTGHHTAQETPTLENSKVACEADWQKRISEALVEIIARVSSDRKMGSFDHGDVSMSFVETDVQISHTEKGADSE